MNQFLLGSMYTRSSIKHGKSVTNFISLKQSILLFSLFTDGGNLYLQLNLVKFWQLLVLYPLPTALCNIVYSYKYLESDLIEHCHVIFIHSLGQPLYVRSHSKVQRSRGNPKEILTWASRVSNYSNFPWFNRKQTWRPAIGSSL
jgi:hypothetical protein